MNTHTCHGVFVFSAFSNSFPAPASALPPTHQVLLGTGPTNLWHSLHHRSLVPQLLLPQAASLLDPESLLNSNN
jgi:hypothetical protein